MKKNKENVSKINYTKFRRFYRFVSYISSFFSFFGSIFAILAGVGYCVWYIAEFADRVEDLEKEMGGIQVIKNAGECDATRRR